jgi:transposase
MRSEHYRRYDAEFREQAVALVERTGRPFAEVASSLGVPLSTLFHWYTLQMARRRGRPKASAGASPAAAPTTETLEEKLRRLERENAALRKRIDDLQMDREILKKAAAFFAKESE